MFFVISMRVGLEFSSIFARINNSTRKRGISLSRLFYLIGRDSYYIATFATFCLVILPLPIPPGCSIILAIPAIFITSQMVCGKKQICIPKFIANFKINKNIVRKIDSVSKAYLTKMESITKRRFIFFVSPKLDKIYNLLLFVLAISSAIPIPFLCMVPATAGVLLSIGLMVKDGLLVVISFIVSLFGISGIWFSIKALLTIKSVLPL